MSAAATSSVERQPAVGSVTILCQAVPYPPRHGGLVDIWNLIRGLHAEGVRIQLVCWFKKRRIPPPVMERLTEFASDVVEVPRRDGIWRMFFLRRPPRALSSKPSRREYRRLRERVRGFAPDWIILDYWVGFLTAAALRRDLDAPLLYRSQNVEFRYYRDLSRVARGMTRLKLWANATRLFGMESEIRRSADLVADICEADREEWAALGAAGNGLVVPPLWLQAGRPWPPERARDIDLLFVGNLLSPNNVEGLEWFLRDVLPILRGRMGQHSPRVLFAGSDPDPRLMEKCRRAAVECVPNPPDVTDFYARARAVINPVLRGSGVNLKMIEAFAHGMQVLATPAAMRGLPRSLEGYFHAAGKDAGEFANAAIALLSREPEMVDLVERARIVDREFGMTKLRHLLDEMRRLSSRVEA